GRASQGQCGYRGRHRGRHQRHRTPAARGDEPADAVLHPGRRRQGRRRHLVLRDARRNARRRRRVRLRQEHDRALDHAPDPQPAGQDRRRRDQLRRQRRPQDERRAGPVDPRQRDRDDLPGPDDLAQPGADGQPPDQRGAPAPHGDEQGAGPGPDDRAPPNGRHPQRRRAGRPVPAPVLRRHAPARDDRDGALVQPEADHRRRADDRPRRHHPGPDPGPDAGPPDRARYRRHPDHPLDGRRRRDVRPDPGDVRRPHRRDGLDRGDLRQPPPPVHGRPDEVDPPPGRQDPREAGADPGAAAGPDRPPRHVPLRAALQLRPREVRAEEPAAAQGRRGALLRVLVLGGGQQGRRPGSGRARPQPAGAFQHPGFLGRIGAAWRARRAGPDEPALADGPAERRHEPHHL
ncbi:MAG: Oligopeptide transport ATP-binding protein OppD, partial [uncultured Thermomicrobiales bacterium]